MAYLTAAYPAAACPAVARTRLLYFVAGFGDEWIVLSEDQRYGPFPRYCDAFERAVSEAQAAGACGFASAVLHASADGMVELRWSYGSGTVTQGGAVPGPTGVPVPSLLESPYR